MDMELVSGDRHKLAKDEKFYSDFSVSLGWQQNFSNYILSSYFLNKCGSILVGANATSDAATHSDIRASDLGLSTTFSGCAWLSPHYQDLLLDFNFFFSWEDLWLELGIPFVHTRWNAGLGSNVTSAGGTHYAFDTLTPNQTPYAVQQDTGAVAVAYTEECALSSALLGNETFGDAPKLYAGKMVNCRRSANGLANTKLELGYDLIKKEQGSLGIGIFTTLPLANQPQKVNKRSLFIFEPKIGSQNAYKFGALVRGQYTLWKNEKNNETVDIFLDGRVAAEFSGQTTRLLGLQANNTILFNQYLLLKKYAVDGDYVTYSGLERAANMLRALVKTEAIPEGQLTIMLQYQKEGIIGGFGYNLFGRGEEKLCIKRRICSDSSHYYVIKGNLPVKTTLGTDAGFYAPSDSNINQTGTALQSGTIWNNILAADMEPSAIRFTDDFTTSGCCNLSDYNGKTTSSVACHPRYISHTIFGHFGYHWYEKNLKPFVGLIAKVDLGQENTALRLWGAYIKGGIEF